MFQGCLSNGILNNSMRFQRGLFRRKVLWIWKFSHYFLQSWHWITGAAWSTGLGTSGVSGLFTWINLLGFREDLPRFCLSTYRTGSQGA